MIFWDRTLIRLVSRMVFISTIRIFLKQWRYLCLGCLLVAVFVSYRKPREYQDIQVEQKPHTISGELNISQVDVKPQVATFTLIMATVAVMMTLLVKVKSNSMILAGLVGGDFKLCRYF